MKKKFKIYMFLGSDCRNELLFFEGYVLFHFSVELLFKIGAVKVCVSVNVTDGNLQKIWVESPDNSLFMSSEQAYQIQW